MTTEQRLDRVESEFATIRQLLTSAATYAESANRRIDDLGAKQDRTQTQLDQLGVKVDQLSNRVDEFVFHTQRLFNKAGSETEETKARTERLEALMLKLDRNYEEQKSQFQEFQRSTNAALERIDRVLDYLLRQSGS
ncbi:6-aminohexanoate hydrolase [Anabaena azotica]|uniref:6-aminohexanoate hydrolase n=1 Tax=Anabaena azotica TaxID=197653 RepID=UPI0039A5A0CE